MLADSVIESLGGEILNHGVVNLFDSSAAMACCNVVSKTSSSALVEPPLLSASALKRFSAVSACFRSSAKPRTDTTREISAKKTTDIAKNEVVTSIGGS